jgi:hypothetical protein
MHCWTSACNKEQTLQPGFSIVALCMIKPVKGAVSLERRLMVVFLQEVWREAVNISAGSQLVCTTPLQILSGFPFLLVKQ